MAIAQSNSKAGESINIQNSQQSSNLNVGRYIQEMQKDEQLYLSNI
jgi:hypothetical protein